MFDCNFICFSTEQADPSGATLQGGEPPFTLTLEVNGSAILGGAGGAGAFSLGGSGITNFPFGIGIEEARTASASLQGLPTDTSAIHVSGSAVSGGGGGAGDVGDGGSGIFAFGAAIVVDQGSVVTGDDGSDGGDGGVGIDLTFGSLAVSGNAQVHGGDGGSDADEPGAGGDGILANGSPVEITDSSATGGLGGTGVGTDGGPGGHGVDLNSCGCSLDATNATIDGGDGGTSDTSSGGSGGEGIIIVNDDATVTGSTVTGGDGGAGTTANGEGGPAISFLMDDDFDYFLDIQTNILTAGSGESGTADSLLVVVDSFVTTGSVCLNATGNTASDDFALTNDSTTGELGITQADVPALSAANGGVVVNTIGTITGGCVIGT